MTVLSAQELARRLPAVLADIARSGEDILITDGNRPLARLVRSEPLMAASEAFSGLAGSLSHDEGEQWLKDMEGFDRTADGLEDPWR